MSNIVDSLVEEYLRDMLPKNQGIIGEMEEYAEENHVPIIQPEVAKLLEVIIKIGNIKSVLEVGTAIGYSSLIFHKAMTGKGKVTTIELREDMYQKALENHNKAGINQTNIKILLGDGRDILPTIDDKFDMVFLDAAKGHYLKFFMPCLDKLNENGIIVSDNVLYKGMIASNKYVKRRKITIVKRMRKYLDYITNHPDLTTSIIPIGDGVAITHKTGRN